MKVLCTADDGNCLTDKHFEAGYTPSSEFDLDIGKEYVVYGICIWKGLLSYLLMGEGLHPHWYPSELFSITQRELPPDWYFAYFGDSDGRDLQALWGYYELINSEDHFDELSELEKDALQVFLIRKAETDEVS